MDNSKTVSEVGENRNILELYSPTTYLLETYNLKDIPGSIKFKTENKNLDFTIELSYSFDNVNYSKWFLYQDEIDTFFEYLRNDYIKGYDIKIQFRITTTMVLEGTFDETKQDEIYYLYIKDILINNVPIEILNKGIINRFDISYSEKTGLWNPYDGMNKGLDLYKTISKSMNNVLGHYVYYFKTDPNKDSKNIHLRTFELYQVVDMKKIKVLVPRNKFPSAINIYHEFGIQFPDEFNIHILQEEFERAFGNHAFPKTKDYLYFPINNIMYEVNAFYKPRTFMEKSIYSELILNKYEHDKNVDKGEYESDTFEYIEIFDDGTLSTDGYKETQGSNPNYMNVELLEAFRLNLHKNLQIVENPLYVGNVQLFNNEYLFRNVLNNEMSLSFNALGTLFNNLTFSFWLMCENTSPSRTITILKDKDNKEICSIKIKQRKLVVELLDINSNQSYIIESDKLENDIQYGIGFSISNMFSEIEMNIIQYNETDKENQISFHTEGKTERIAPIANSLKFIEFYGGPHLISNIRLDDIKVKSDNFINHITTVLPDSKTNILFDKAHLPISNESFTI